MYVRCVPPGAHPGPRLATGNGMHEIGDGFHHRHFGGNYLAVHLDRRKNLMLPTLAAKLRHQDRQQYEHRPHQIPRHYHDENRAHGILNAIECAQHVGQKAQMNLHDEICEQWLRMTLRWQ